MQTTLPVRAIWILPMILPAFFAVSMCVELRTEYEWKYFEYKYDIGRKDQWKEMYNYRTLIPTDFLRVSENKTLIATPQARNQNDISRLSRISAESSDSGPLLEPYPSNAWHITFFYLYCPKITSVSKIFMDDCNRIWVVDSGKLRDLQICPPQILAFDADTDELVEKFVIPMELARNSKTRRPGRLQIQFVETKDSCSKTWVYVGDPEGYGMVIWDGKDVWRLENDEVYGPDKTATTFDVDGQRFDQEVGASGFVVIPPGFLHEDYMMLRPVASQKAYAVKVEDLHNSKDGKPVTYYKGNVTLPSQELTRAFSESGALIGSLASQSALSCWYPENPLAAEYIGIPLRDPVALQYAVSGKIVRGKGSRSGDEEFWILSTRNQRFATNTVNFNETNFRIMSVNVAELINGTVCEPSGGTPKESTIEDKFFFKMEN
ncbi:major royal jelly protein 1-like [Athalia rosae]|uniref:major royal jelly protein 1-like n=1 Tax=Athalia rosae TaxID=37344 RepID=UPI002033ACDC|nr:major royal jelly protein 1-like [Athalia rosae]